MAENQELSQGERNRRSLKNLFVSPAGQVRLIFVFPVVGLVAVAFLLWALWSAIDSRLESVRLTAPAAMAGSLGDLERVSSHIFGLGIGFTLICALMVAAFGLLISHRFYGPVVPILRSLRAMANGDYGERIQLRKSDELKEVAEAVNHLAETLGARGEKR